MKLSRKILLIIMKWQVNTMKIKKLAAAVLAAATAIIPLSSNGIAILPSSTSYAAQHATGAALPEWIPQNFESALDFRNTYGATHVQDGLVCIVFREQAEKVPEGEPQGMLRYEIRTTEGMMEQLYHNYLGSEESQYNYEVAVYYAPKEQGKFEVALVDTWLKSSELDLGYNHAIARYSFSIDEEYEITETDMYGWLPDCYTEYKDYVSSNGPVSVKDEFVVFCIDDTAGIRYQWYDVSKYEQTVIQQYTSSYCAMETAQLLAGGKIPHMEVYKAVDDGNALIKWSFVPSDDYQRLQASKNLYADCTVSDSGKKVTINDDFVQNADFSYNNYSIYGNDLLISGEDAYLSYEKPDSRVVSSQKELSYFLSSYLNETALKKFVSKYSDKYFENNVLMLSTYIDAYHGRVSRFGLDKVFTTDNILFIDYSPIISGVQSKTSYFSILQLSMPKSEYNKDTEVTWSTGYALADNVKCITFVDTNTNQVVDMGDTDLSKLFGIEIKNVDGHNPYYWDVITAEWLDLKIDEKYLPNDYKLFKDFPVSVIDYGNNTGDIIFRLTKDEPPGIKFTVDKYSAITRNLFTEDAYKDLASFKPKAFTTRSELNEVISKYFSEEYQEKIFCAYDDKFFKNNVLLLNFFIDSTGGKKVSIENAAVTGDEITVYYNKPSTDFQICNTDFFFILQASVPKSEYSGQKADFKCVGDANGDGDLGIADLVTLQKWLHGSSDTKLADVNAVDLCKDGTIDIFDLVAMRKKIIKIHDLDAPVKYAIEAQYLRAARTPSGNREPVVNIITSAGEMKSKVQTSYRAEELEKYDDIWFSTHKLMVISIEEGSGSIRHGITELYSDHVTINRTIPDTMTADMAVWDIFIELDKNARISDDFTVNFTETKLF